MLAIYCRISQKKDDGKDRSIDYQKNEGVKLANSLNLEYKLYIDEGVSGTWEITKRPAFFELLKDLTDKKNVITTVFALDASRLYRSDQTRLTFLASIKKRNINLYFNTGIFDWSDPYMDFMGKVLSATDVLHVDITRLKVRGVLIERAKKGKVQGILPYGYCRDENEMMDIEPVEAELVKRIFKLSLQGWGYRKITDQFNDEDIPTRYNQYGGTLTYRKKGSNGLKSVDKKDIRWNHTNIRNILRNRVYLGERFWGGVKQPCPAIIDIETFNKVKYRVNSGLKKSGKDSSYKYLLNNLCKCGLCGKRFTGRKSGNYRHYRCTSILFQKVDKCGNGYMDVVALESFIWERFFYSHELYKLVETHLKNNGTRDKVKEIKEHIQSIERANNALRSERTKAIQLTLKGVFAESDIKSELIRIDASVNDNDIKLDRANEQLLNYLNSSDNLNDLKKDLSNIKKDIGFDIRQQLVEKYIKEIEVIKTPAFFEIVITFNIADMRKEYYKMEHDYTLAFITGELGKNLHPIKWLSANLKPAKLEKAKMLQETIKD
ncbi:recombinase family protein [Zobellia nedashkovskayae]|uniref:recombinase family protein n=1 Tax=Zobellia nedashkovskayae TaxID=2779510 RepID=UPI00188CE114|nr:recombinase family protein [Zobellia nedashkovskayae]